IPARVHLLLRDEAGILLDEERQQAAPSRSHVEVVEVTLEAGRLEVPVHAEHALAATCEQHCDVGQRHAPADTALERVERDDPAHGPRPGTWVCCGGCLCSNASWKLWAVSTGHASRHSGASSMAWATDCASSAIFTVSDSASSLFRFIRVT